MKIRTLLMAASAAALLASPAFAACEDQVTELQQQIEEASLNQEKQQKLEDKLFEARNALANDNEAQCMDVVASIETELRNDQSAQAQTGAEAGTAGAVISTQAETGMERTPPQPEGFDNQRAEVEIRQAEPDVTVERVGEPEITYEGFEGEERITADVTNETEAEADAGIQAEADMMGEDDAEIVTGADFEETNQLRVSDIEGRPARTIDGTKLGDIEDIVRDPNTGETFVVISSGGFLGFGGEETAVPLSRVDLTGEEPLLNLSDRTELKTYGAYEEERYVAVEDDQPLSSLQRW